MRSKVLFLVLLSSLFINLSWQEKQDRKPQSQELDKAVDSVSAENLKRHESYLAGDELEGRCAGYEGNNKATEYIATHWKKLGLKPVGDKDKDGNPSYFQKFTFRKTYETRNTVAFFEGNDDKLKDQIIVIGAHHDHVGKEGQGGWGKKGGPKGDDNIWNGADDNASGTSSVLEIARAFMEGKIKTRRSILFMTFSAEEAGLLGSAHYVKNSLFPRKNHKAMVNLDMVGRSTGYVSLSNFQTSPIWDEIVEKAKKGLKIEVKTKKSELGGSDHMSFDAAGIPNTQLFTPMHSDYHKITDHPDRIEYDHMADICKLALRMIVLLADADDIPNTCGKK